MGIVNHAKTNNIPNWTQPQLDIVVAGGQAPLLPAGTVLNDIVEPSDWNDDHILNVTNAHIIVGNGSNIGADVAVSGDATLANTGALTVTKTNGVPFAASATTDTTTIANITGTKAQFNTACTDGDFLYVGDITGLTDGDKGDITVSSSGTVWTIDNSAVTLAKQADVATSTVFYRKTAGTGAPEVNTLATLKTDLGLTGTNSGDQTITLTGAVTGSGTGSFATTIATPGTLTVSSTNSTITAHTHAVTSSSAPGAAASLLATDSSGIIGSTGTRIVKGWFTDLTVTNNITGSITGNAATVTTNANLTGPITSVGNATAIASQTGTGTKFVVDTSPTLVTPNIGVATGTSLQAIIGNVTPAAGTFTDLTINGATTIGDASTDTLTHNAAVITVPTSLVYTKTAQAGVAETLFTWKVSDSTSTFTLVNGTNADGQFAPTFNGVIEAGNEATALSFFGTRGTATVPGNPAILFLTRYNSGAGNTDTPATGIMVEFRNRATNGFYFTGGYNFVYLGGSTSPSLAAAAADTVSTAGVDKAAGDRRLYIQSELGSGLSLGNDRFNYVAATGYTAVADTDIGTWTSSGLQLPCLGVGTAPLPLASGLALVKNFTDPVGGSQVMSLTSITNSLTANNAQTIHGFNSLVELNQNGFNHTAAFGVRGATSAAYGLGATGTITGVAGFVLQGGNLGAGTVTNFYGIEIATGVNSGGGTLTNFYGIDVGAQTAASTLNVGIRSSIASSATGGWNLRMDGTAPNYMAGTLQLGHTGAALGKIESRATSGAQIVGSYDASNYWTATTASNGAITFDAVGAGAAFTFSDNVAVPDQAFGATWDGSTNVPTKNAVYDMALANPGILSTTTSINAKATGTTTLYTVPGGKTAIILGAVVRCTAATAITVGPSLGIGVAAGEDDIFASTAITALTTTAKIYHFTALGMSVSAAAAAVIKVGIDTASTGTSQTIAIDLIGYLL